MPLVDLFDSIESGDLTAVKQKLAADPEAIEARNPEGLSPLVVAAYWGQREILDYLVESTQALDFWEAATVGDTGRVAQLLREQQDLAAARSPDGFTALHLAVFFGHPDTAQSLIEAGAEVAARTSNALDNQPLHAAVAGGNADTRLSCVQLLLGAGTPVDERQSGGFAPLMTVAQNGDQQVLDLLLAHGADPSLRDNEGRSAADLAKAAGHPVIAARLAT